ncbi:MAG: LysM peptidoglycan-binding domain-containing protein [Clostridiales bacterium]|nr:LysM peptidoglycan-binding domain-containing protein [Clostridiales bacterium]
MNNINANEMIKSPSQMLTPFFDGRVTSELSADYILPDTYPDVKKILRVRARPINIGRFISGRRLEYSGAVDYIVVFCSEASGEGEMKPDSLHAVHFAAEYNGALDSPDDSASLDSCEISIVPQVTACSARLQNPRKLSIKASVANDIKLSRIIPCSPKVEGASTLEEEMKLERLTTSMPTLLEKCFTADHEQLSENLEPDASQPAIDEIVTCDAEIHFHEVKPNIGADGFTVMVKGEALIDCIYRAQGEVGDYRSFARKLPLSYMINADEYAEFFKNCKPDTLCGSATGTLTELNAAVGENSYGERRVLELDLSFDIDVKLLADADTPLTLDVYSVDRDSNCDMRTLDLSSMGKLISSNFSVNEGIPRDELGLPGEADAAWNIVDTQAEVKMNSAVPSRGRTQISGEALISCILSDRSGGFAAAEFTLPVKCELSTGELAEPIAFICDCKAYDIRARLDPNRLSCDFEVSLNALFIKKARTEAVETVKISKEPRAAADESASLVLCYPSAGESLWQIAKRYNTTTSAISAMNSSLSSDGETPHVIMIPVGRGAAMSKIM